MLVTMVISLTRLTVVSLPAPMDWVFPSLCSHELSPRSDPAASAPERPHPAHP